MRRTATIWKVQLVLFATALIASSCTDHNDVPSGKEEGITKAITISVAIPSETNPQTRAIGAPQENTINTLDLLAFRVDNTGGEYFDYYGEGKRLSSDNGLSKQTFEVNVTLRTTQQRLVLIANAGTKVKDLIASRDWKNAEKTAMLRNLEMDLDGDRWKAISADNYTALPMWGESGTVILTASTDKLTQAIPLLRMVAKVDVRLSSGSPALGKFKLKSVRLYNTRAKGVVVPDASVLREETNSGERFLSVTAPTVPSSDAKIGPVLYTDFSAPGIKDVAMEGAIYAFESENSIGIERTRATGLVVGGIFGTDAQETYYRVDFVADDNKTYLDILRNHQYIINIADVKQRGYDNPDDAWNGASENLEVTILVWTESGMHNIIFNNDFYLSVSQEAFAFSSAELRAKYNNQNALYIKTNYTSVSGVSGWRIAPNDIVDDSGYPVSWLTVSVDHGDPDVLTETLLLMSKNTTGAERRAVIYVSAGRFRYPITVVQTTLQQPSVKIFYGYDITATMGNEIDELIFAPRNFGSSSGSGQNIVVQWEPADKDMIPFCSPIGNIRFFPTTNDVMVQQFATNDRGWSAFYIASFQPIDGSDVGGIDFYKRAVNFTFTTSNGIADASKTLPVYLIYPEIKISEATVTVNANMDMDMDLDCPLGATTIYLRSNAAWKVESLTDNNNLLTNGNEIRQQTGNANPVTGTPLNIRVAGGANLNYTATIVFEILDPSTNPSLTGQGHHKTQLTIHPVNQ